MCKFFNIYFFKLFSFTYCIYEKFSISLLNVKQLKTKEDIMEFIKELQKQNESFNTANYRMLKRIKAGNYFLSIQGSNGHYCRPRLTLPVDVYTHMELAIFNKKGSMVSINRSKVFRNFSGYNELISMADSLNSKATVYGFVSVDLLNDLYCFLCGKK